MVIPAVVKDPGGTNGVLPVVRELREEFGCDVRLIANGTAVKLLSETLENYEVLSSAGEVSRRYPYPGALLTSMCSTGGVGKASIPFFKGRCPTVSFHDYWGTCLLRDGWEDPRYHPDFFVVNDELDAEMVLKAWPDYKKDQLVITGYPMFDQYAVKYDETALLAEVSSKLEADVSSKPIVLVPCGVYGRVNEFLLEVIDVLNEINSDIYFVPRLHPRLGLSFPGEIELCRQVIQKFRGGTLIADSSACTTPSLIRASTVVVSDFSTTLLEAILVRKPNISAWTDSVRQAYQEEFGFVKHLMPEPPFVTLGCSAKATNRVVLGQYISDALNGKLELITAQEKYFPLDGKNAKRAARFISSLG